MLSDPRQISRKSSQAASFQGFPPSLVLTLSQVLFQFNLHVFQNSWHLPQHLSTSFNIFQHLSNLLGTISNLSTERGTQEPSLTLVQLTTDSQVLVLPRCGLCSKATPKSKKVGFKIFAESEFCQATTLCEYV